MTRRLALLVSAAAAAFLSVSCAQSPTSPTATTSGLTVGGAAQETPSLPASIIPTPPRAVAATRFVAFGDSITCGQPSVVFDSLTILDCQYTGYPERLRSMLNAYNPGQQFFVTKRGLPGERASQGEQRLTTELTELAGPSVPVSLRPQVLLLLEGINDMIGGVSPTRAASSVAQMVQIAKLFNLTVLVATMPQTYYTVAPDGRIRDNAHTQITIFNTEIRRLAGQNVHIVDLYAAFGTNAYQTLMGDDGLHPTSAGYDVIAQRFHAAILETFPVRGSVQ
jgi:lysophospholipase L1-like esterase